MWTGLIIMTIKQTLNRQSADHGLLYDLATVVYLNMYILIIIGLNSHKRTKFT